MIEGRFGDRNMLARTLSEQLAVQADRFPDRTFVGVGGETLTFGQLRDQSDAVAAGLAAAGVRHGDRVALIMKNRIEFLVAFFAVVRIGAIVTPVNIFLKGSFLAHQLTDTEASVVIADRDGVAAVAALADELPALVHIFSVDPPAQGDSRSKAFASLRLDAASLPDTEVRAADIAAILYTSGTTGLPKGCMLSHGYYLASPHQFFIDELIVPDDRIFTAYPLYHASGNLVSLMVALHGAIEILFTIEFSASQFMAQAKAAGATVVWGVGAMGAAILASPEKPTDGETCFRLALFVPMTATAQVRFEARFNTPVMAEMYGQTEVSPITMAPLDPDRVRGSLGRVVNAIEVRLVDADERDVAPGETGEIIVRPRQPEAMFSGYWRGVQDKRQSGWHRTGDTAKIDEKGYLHFMDRTRDAIRRRGVNISSVQIEQAIVAHPGIAAVAAHPVPSSLGDDDIKACIVAEPSATLDPEELFTFFRGALPYYAVPRYVEIIPELPVNALGRVLKHELRKRDAHVTWDFEALGFAVSKLERRT